jgi:hypothetical protein
MVDAVEAIPVTGIFLTDAFGRVFRATTPHWRDLQARLSNPGSREDWDDHDHAERCANEVLRNAFTDGSLTPLVHRHGSPQRLPREGWELRAQFETGIASNFVTPNDPMNPGPRTGKDGERHAIFIDRGEFDQWLQSIFPMQDQRLAVSNSAPLPEVVPSHPRGGKKKGDGSYDALDQPRIAEMAALIRDKKAASPEQAARMVAEQAFGDGSPESKADRLAKRFRKLATAVTIAR